MLVVTRGNIQFCAKYILPIALVVSRLPRLLMVCREEAEWFD